MYHQLFKHNFVETTVYFVKVGQYFMEAQILFVKFIRFLV